VSFASRTALGACLVALAACAGSGIPDAEIPDDPIAIVYFDPEIARLRAEAFADEEKHRSPRRPAPAAAGSGTVPNVNDIATYVGNLLGAVVSSSSDDLAGRLVLFDPKTGARTPVPGARRGATPQAWSPDRRRLLFSQAVRGQPQLYEVDIESGDVRSVTSGPAAHPQGCYGPEGRLVLMSVDVTAQRAPSRILLTGPGGTRPRPISPGPYDVQPACAPDGSSIAYTSSSPRGRDRLVVRAPVVKGEPRVIAPGHEPAFSRDGAWIVYSAPVHKGWKLWRIRPDGTGRAPVGQGSLDELRPAISPDGRYVVYVAGEDFRKRLYLRRFDGTGDRILLADGDGERPVW
jgi:TolB protein